MKSVTSFSVIITCYNYHDFVIEAIESALGQSRGASQVIVVDDGSTDGSREILWKNYAVDSRVTLVFGDNGGQLAAFKRGVALATGMVICFLDADDRWRSDYLAKIGAIYDSRQDIDFVFTDMQFFGNEQGCLQFADRDLDLGFTTIVTYMTAHWYGAPTSAVSLRSTWARRVLELPEHLNETFKISADNCLVYGSSILGARKYYLLTSGSVQYRIHGKNGWGTTQPPTKKYLNMLFRVYCLIELYGEQVGLTENCRHLASREFLDKPTRDWNEALRYASITRRHKSGRRKEPTIRRWLKTLLLYLRGKIA